MKKTTNAPVMIATMNIPALMQKIMAMMAKLYVLAVNIAHNNVLKIFNNFIVYNAHITAVYGLLYYVMCF